MASEQTILELNELDGDWETWIRNVIDTKDFSVATKSFEELLSILPEDVNIWREYLDYLKKFHKIEILEVYSRCCHMFLEETYFWQDYLFQLERFGQEWNKLYEIFEEALGYTDNIESATALYRTIIYAKARYVRIDSIGKDTVDYAPVGELFENAYKYLREEYGQYWDESKGFTRNYAYFAFYRLKNVELGRKLWREILGSFGKKARCWMEAADMERRFGTVDAARTLLYRGINSVFDNYEPLFDYIVQFERDEGNFEQLQKALKKVNDQMAKILQAKESHKKNEAKENAKKNLFKGGAKQQPQIVASISIQKKQPEHFQKPDTPRQPPRKRPAMTKNGGEPLSKILNDAEPEVMKDKDGFVIPHIPVRLSPRSDGSSPVNSDSSSSKAMIVSGIEKPPKATPMEVDATDPNKTVFVSNLDFAVSEQEISPFFPGNIEIRLVKRPGTNVSKGYGYVDFATAEEAQAALKLDRTPYKGRPVFVSANNPHPQGEHAEFKYSTDIERNKLFVKNLPFKCNNDQLKEEFSAYGKVKDARIVTKKSGISKCCGYVEFETEADAAKALSAQIQIGGRPISVWISNPPAKTDSKSPHQQQQQQQASKNQKSALGSRSKPMATPTNAGRKMRIESFVPRSVTISKPKPVN